MDKNEQVELDCDKVEIMLVMNAGVLKEIAVLTFDGMPLTGLKSLGL